MLRLLEERCSFESPRLLFESEDGDFDVRTMVSGETDPWRTYAAVRDSRERAARLGTQIGAILAEQHTRIRASDAAPWLPRQPAWPESRDWIRDRLPAVTDDVELIARAETLMDAYASVSVEEADCVLVHTDVGFHNLAIDAASYVVRGERVVLYNAACAITFLAYRVGTAPDETWCGRTLAEDLLWSEQAVAKALAAAEW